MTPLQVALVESSPLVRARLKEALADVPGLAIAGTAETEDTAIRMFQSTPWDAGVVDLQLCKVPDWVC